jgi:hypothetical protein
MEGLATRRDPVKNRTFDTFGVIGPGTCYSLLNLNSNVRLQV